MVSVADELLMSSWATSLFCVLVMAYVPGTCITASAVEDGTTPLSQFADVFQSPPRSMGDEPDHEICGWAISFPLNGSASAMLSNRTSVVALSCTDVRSKKSESNENV